MNSFLARFLETVINKQVVIVALISIVSIVTMSYIAPKVFATSSFTATNVTLDPASGLVQWDFDSAVDGSGVTGGLSWRLVEPSSGNAIWYDTDRGTCVLTGGSIYHCSYAVIPVRDDASVTQIVLQASGGGAYQSQTLDYPLPRPKNYETVHPSAGAGWVPAIETWTYASADAPTYTYTVSGDQTDKYSPGMRVRLIQSSTTKYFLITGVSYASGTTTVTVYGGTDYTLANSTISSPFYSMQKAPLGFPIDPAKWTVQTIYASNGNQGSPTASTWYNIGSASIDVPVGAWRLFYSTNYGYDQSTVGFYNAYVTLSTSNNSESDVNMTDGVTMGNSTIAIAKGNKEKFINLTSKATYYLNVRTTVSGLNFLYLGGTATPTIIQATSTYL